MDASSLLGKLDCANHAPAVVYADPPYSRAQYSRYYHVLDVLVRYDYPETAGESAYPSGRFQTAFSQEAKVSAAMDQLVGKVAQIGATLILSYPSTGLLYHRNETLHDLLRRHFRRVELAYDRRHTHSTFGAPKTRPTVPAREQIFVAR